MLYQPRLGLGDLATAQIVSSFFEGYPFAFEDCQDRKLEKNTKRSLPFQTNSHWSKELQLAARHASSSLACSCSLMFIVNSANAPLTTRMACNAFCLCSDRSTNGTSNPDLSPSVGGSGSTKGSP